MCAYDKKERLTINPNNRGKTSIEIHAEASCEIVVNTDHTIAE
jgi:hypothetical protein